MAKNIKHLDDQNFAEGISSGLVLVDFFADWCGPCKQLTPILEELAQEIGEQATVAKLDIDRSLKTTSSFEVTSVPTLILFKDGKEAQRVVGLKNKETLKKLISEVAKA